MINIAIELMTKGKDANGKHMYKKKNEKQTFKKIDERTNNNNQAKK